MFKQGFGTYSKQQSPSIQRMQTLYFKMAKQCCLEKRDVLHLTERTDTCLEFNISAIMPPEKLQVGRITNLPNHTPARINKKQHSFHPHRLFYILHECYIIETCSDKLLQFRYYVQPCFATPYNLWILTVHRLLNIDSGTQAASTFVPYSYREFCIEVEIPIFKGEAEETHRLVLKTRQTEDLKLCSQTPKLQVQHQFTIKHL
jgi:hypothetical protein